MNPPVDIRHCSARDVAAAREELLDLHDAVYAGTGDPLADRSAFGLFLDHWASAVDFACTTARTRRGTLVGYAYGAPLTAGTSWWEDIEPPLDAAAAAEDGARTFAVSELLVDAASRGTGTARALHDVLLDGRPEHRSTLLAHADHPKVVALYETWGYRRLGECVPFDGAPRLVAMLRS